jgi:hypothetical protein
MKLSRNSKKVVRCSKKSPRRVSRSKKVVRHSSRRRHNDGLNDFLNKAKETGSNISKKASDFGSNVSSAFRSNVDKMSGLDACNTRIAELEKDLIACREKQNESLFGKAKKFF